MVKPYKENDSLSDAYISKCRRYGCALHLLRTHLADSTSSQFYFLCSYGQLLLQMAKNFFVVLANKMVEESGVHSICVDLLSAPAKV